MGPVASGVVPSGSQSPCWHLRSLRIPKKFWLHIVQASTCQQLDGVKRKALCTLLGLLIMIGNAIHLK